MKNLLPGVLLLAAFSAAQAAEKAPPPALLTGRPTALASTDAQGNTRVRGETFRLLVPQKDGTPRTVPLDLQENPELGLMLLRLGHREITLEGTLVTKAWPLVWPVPWGGGLKAVIPTDGVEVLRVSEVRVNFDKAPVVKPAPEDD
jgi:hypothetical protein